MSALLAPTPIFKAFDNNGLPLAFGFLTTYAAGTLTKIPSYVDASQTTQNTNPVQLNFRGECPLWLDPTLTYKFALTDQSGNTIPGWPVDNIPGNGATGGASIIPTADNAFTLGNPSFSWANVYVGVNHAPVLDIVSGNISYYARTAAEIGAGVTPVSFAYPPTPIGDARRYCNLVLDGSTDNTTAISGMWTALATYRGPVTIPYNCKFNKATVYSTIPVGVILIDQSSVNTGQPPAVKNKHIDQVTNDTASDDANQGIISSHHPALRLNNLHTAGTASAIGRYHSILYAAGFRWTGDAIDGFQHLVNLSNRVAPPNYLWRNSWVMNTKAQAAVLSVHWTALTAKPTGSVIDTTDGNVWINNGALGTTASTEPTGTGPTFSDGGVTWTWLYAWNVASTLFFFDEDGYASFGNGAVTRFGAGTATRQGISLNANDSTHDVSLHDDDRNQDLWRLSDAAGLRHGGIRSLNYGGAISGATPTISGEIHTVNNVGATNMTNLVLPASQTSGYVILQFQNSNTTVKASGFNIKGNIDVTPASGNIITFYKEPSISGSWTEISRNF